MSAPSSLALLRLIGWLRWRVMLNAIMRSGSRDFLERLSRASESALPLAILLLAIPAAVALAGLGIATGWFLARGPGAAPLLQVVRFALLAVTMLALFAPVILSASQQTSGIVRMLLLPIPRRVLYIAQALGALADPWVLLAIPLMIGIAIGLAAQAQLAAAATAVVAAAAMMAVLLGVSALSTVCLQLLVRNRRRAEALALFGTLLLVAMSLIPAALTREHGEKRRGAGGNLPVWVTTASVAVPSELYSRTIESAAARAFGQSSSAALALVLWALATHGLTWPLYVRLLEVPTSTGGVARYSGRHSFGRSIPLMGRRASAVAVNFVRLAYRTPRGRSLVLAPIVMMAAFGVLFTIRGQTIPVGPFRIGGGFTLALFGAVIAVLSLAPLLLNQFAVDGAGLTMTFLAPVSDRDVLRGKAVGGFLIALGPMLIGIAAGVLTGAYAVSLWIALALGIVAVYIVYAPTAAMVAMILPRSVDLSAIGNASNAHQGAALLGMLAFGMAAAPPALLAFVAERVWDNDRTVALAVAAWLIIAMLMSFVLFRIAEKVLRSRRENLALVAQGR